MKHVTSISAPKTASSPLDSLTGIFGSAFDMISSLVKKEQPV